MNELEQRHPSAGEVVQGVDLTGKVVIVTGASAGLGVETARAMAATGADVILAARDQAKTEAVMAEIRQGIPSTRLHFQALDLADLKSAKAAALSIRKRFPAVHRVIANAGVMACPEQRTAEGCEWQFGVNHIGHFQFICELVPALQAGAPARVVVLSSAGHRYSPVNFDDPHFEQRPYDKWLAYGQAKTANVLFAWELNRRLQAQGISAFAVHPGAIVTELGRHLERSDLEVLTAQSQGGKGFAFKPPEWGAATSVWAAVSPDLDDKGGLYLHDCSIGKPTGDDREGPEAGYRPYAMDPDAAARLWVLSEQIVGQQYRF